MAKECLMDLFAKMLDQDFFHEGKKQTINGKPKHSFNLNWKK